MPLLIVYLVFAAKTRAKDALCPAGIKVKMQERKKNCAYYTGRTVDVLYAVAKNADI